MKKIKFNVSKTNTGYDAYSEASGVIIAVTTGTTLSELKTNCLEAYNLYLEEKGKPGILLDQIAFNFDLTSFFDFYKEISASGLAERIGMHKSLLSEYINWKRKPSDKQVKRILKGIKELVGELSEIDFFV